MTNNKKNRKIKDTSLITSTIIILIGVGIISIGTLLLIFNITEQESNAKICYYELKDGTTCNEIYLGDDISFKDCSDGFIHNGEAYREICK